jgi:hypothetical protein
MHPYVLVHAKGCDKTSFLFILFTEPDLMVG